MEWTGLLGNLGEFLGSIAVMVTLAILVVQVRQSAKAVEESNRLQRAAALDRHSDTIGRWRHQIAGSSDMAQIWHDARNDKPLDAVEFMRLNFMFINFVNAQRSNYIRAHTVSDLGLARQAVLAVAVEASISETFRREWMQIRPWNSLASADYTSEVEAAIAEYAQGGNQEYAPGGPHFRSPQAQAGRSQGDSER